MIIPARWYAGGKGLDEFRKTMLEDKRIVRIVDYVNAKDCFSGINLGGGICYFCGIEIILMSANILIFTILLFQQKPEH